MSPQGKISSVPVSHKDNNGVYSAAQQITELRQTVGCVYQHQRCSPRLHINASLLCVFIWLALERGQLLLPLSAFLSSPLSLIYSVSSFCLLHFLPVCLSSSRLSSSFHNSSSFCYMPCSILHLVGVCQCVSMCVCVRVCVSWLIYYAVGETKVQEMEVRTHH